MFVPHPEIRHIEPIQSPDHKMHSDKNGNSHVGTTIIGNAVAGVVGGFTSSLIMHPLDVVTTRLQAQDGRTAKIPNYRNPITALITIARTEGVRNLYVGVVPNLLGSTTNWGVYFLGYNYSRNLVREYLHRLENAEGGEAKELGPLVNLMCATWTGCISAFITQPIWLAKTKLQLQQKPNIRYTGMFHCWLSVYQEGGYKAIFRGLVPSLFLVSHIALHFMTYEELKRMQQRLSDKEHLSPEQTVVAASGAKFFATVATYPSQVIRTRLQLEQQLEQRIGQAPSIGGGERLQHSYKGVGDVLRKILQYEGVRGLYKGLGANFLRVIPTTAITFVVYESVAHRLGAHT